LLVLSPVILLTRRPAELPAADQMQVQVVDTLAAVLAVVDDAAVTVTVQPLLRGDTRGDNEQAA